MIELNDTLNTLWRGRDSFQILEQIEGEEFRHVKSRRTFRFEVEDKGYFAKIHHGVGWCEIFKNLFQLKAPVLGASNEYNALKMLTAADVNTMKVAGYGCHGWNPAKLDSFLITEELTGMISLEDFSANWKHCPPNDDVREKIITGLAKTVGKMHALGINHRDCYICHFLLRPENPSELYVIDLHRAQIRKRVPRRYLVKDLAGLMFSSFDWPLMEDDVKIFIRGYATSSGLKTDEMLYKEVCYAASKLYAKEFGRESEVDPAKFVLTGIQQ